MAGAAAVLWSTGRVSIPKGARAVKPFDLNRYLGKWFEIARFDFKFERNLKNVTADYSLNDDGSIKIENRGYNFVKNEWKESIGKARFVGDRNEGRLKVSFFGPFYSAYNVLALDEDYRHTLVAGDDLGHLWILSRDRKIPADIKDKYLRIAREIGYNTGELVWTGHDEPPIIL